MSEESEGERERWDQGWDECYRSSKEKKNKKTKTGKRRAGEKRKRKQATDFKEAVLPFCGRSRGSIAKK